MPSSNKTAHLQLNRWSGSDKPKMADFNGDNQKLDDGVKALNSSLTAHLASTLVHLTTADKERLSRVLSLDMTTYTGNGSLQRKIQLGYRARLGVIFAVGKPMFEINAYDYSLKQFAAVFSENGCSEAVTLESDGVSFTYSSFNRPDGNGLRLNEDEVNYVVIAMR